MSRVLVQAWGPDAKAYIGRSLTLYRDPTVKWAGMEIGGIRISHMSHIDGAKQMMLTATKGSRKPFKVLPLVMQRSAPRATGLGDDAASRWANGFIAKLAEFTTSDAVQNFAAQKATSWPSSPMRGLTCTRRSPPRLPRARPILKPAAPFDDDDFSDQDRPADDQPTEVNDAAGQSLAEQIGLDDPHPAQAKADAIIAEVNAADAIIDVNSIVSRNAEDIAAMPAEIGASIEIAADKRKRAITAERQAERARRSPRLRRHRRQPARPTTPGHGVERMLAAAAASSSPIRSASGGASG
jgi:hypothetical protein